MGNSSPAVNLDEDVVKPLVFEPVGDIELKHHETLENVLDAAHTELAEKRA